MRLVMGTGHFTLLEKVAMRSPEAGLTEAKNLLFRGAVETGSGPAL
jgi:hypothetical protein